MKFLQILLLIVSSCLIGEIYQSSLYAEDTSKSNIPPKGGDKDLFVSIDEIPATVGILENFTIKYSWYYTEKDSDGNQTHSENGTETVQHGGWLHTGNHTATVSHTHNGESESDSKTVGVVGEGGKVLIVKVKPGAPQTILKDKTRNIPYNWAYQERDAQNNIIEQETGSSSKLAGPYQTKGIKPFVISHTHNGITDSTTHNLRVQCDTTEWDKGDPELAFGPEKLGPRFRDDGYEPDDIEVTCADGTKGTIFRDRYKKFRQPRRLEWQRSLWKRYDVNCNIVDQKYVKLTEPEWVDQGDPVAVSPAYGLHRHGDHPCKGDAGGTGGGDGADGVEGEEKGQKGPNTGEVDFIDEEQYICVDGGDEYNLDFIYKIITHDTPRSRSLHGKLKLELVSGDEDIAEIFHGGEAYEYGTEVDVTEAGHSGGGVHTWHGGSITFTFKPKQDEEGNYKEGTIKVKGICDPDPEEEEGDGSPTVTPTLTIHFIKLNMLVDSDNDGEISEEKDEEVEEENPGKIVLVNSVDTDEDGIPDFADGFDFAIEEGAAQITSTSKFSEVQVNLPEELINGGLFSVDDLKLEFSYSDNYPGVPGIDVQNISNGSDSYNIYTPKDGNFRLWLKDASESRKGSDLIEGGDFLSSGEEYILSELPGASSGQITLYLEAINPSLDVGADSLVVTLKEVEDGKVVCTDEVKLTSVALDLQIDSNNDGQINSLDSAVEDGPEDDGSKPGALLFVNDGDIDLDTVPDFADGMDKFENDGITFPEADVSAEFNLLKLSLSAIPDQFRDKARIKFVYSSSDPNDINRQGSKDNYTYTPANGKLRLWRKNSDGKQYDSDQVTNERLSGSVGTGDFIPSDQGVSLEDLGYQEGQDTINLYVEAIEVSDEIRDAEISVQIDLDGTDGGFDFQEADKVECTIINISVATVNENGKLTYSRDAAMSHASPEVSIANLSISNVTQSADNSFLQGDIQVSGSLASEISNRVSEANGGVIDHVKVFLNDDSEPIATIAASVSKANNPNSLLEPYPFSAIFNEALNGVAMVDGINILRLESGRDVKGAFGQVEYSFTVQATPPIIISESSIFSIELTQDLSDDEVDVIEARLVSPAGDTGSVTLTETLKNSNIFRSVSNEFEFRLLSEVESFNVGSVDKLSGVVYHSTLAPGEINTRFLTESSVDTLVFTQELSGFASFEMILNESLNDETQGSIDATLTTFEGTTEVVTLEEQGVLSNVYVSVDSLFKVTILDVDEDNNPLNVSVEEAQLGEFSFYSLDNYNLEGIIFRGFQDYSLEELLFDSYEGFTVNSDNPIRGEENAKGKETQKVVVAEGPKKYLENTKELQINDTNGTLVDPSGRLEFEQIGVNHFYIWSTGEVGPVKLIEINELATAIFNDDSLSDEQKVLEFLADLSIGRGVESQFLLGFAFGVWDGGKLTVEGLIELGEFFVKESNPLTQINRMSRIVIRYTEGDDFVKERQLFKTSVDTVGVIGSFFWDQMKASADKKAAFIDALIAGDTEYFSEEYQKIGDSTYKAYEISAEVFDALIEYIDGKSEYEKGYFTGRVAFEVATLVISWTKAAKVAGTVQKFTKANFLKFLEKTKFFKSGSGKQLLANIKATFLPKLLITKMCFVAGTPIHTVDGLVSIEDIQPGMQVLSRDPYTHQQGYKSVVQTFVTNPTRLYHLRYRIINTNEAESISGTGEHPFWVASKQSFIPIKDLIVGDLFSLTDGSLAELKGIEIEDSEVEPFATYNFEVESYHTYFAGESGVWVHNLGKTACEQMFSFFEMQLKRAGGNVWDAFDKTRDAIKLKKLKMPDVKFGYIKLLNKSRVEYFDKLKDGIAQSTPYWRNLKDQTKIADLSNVSGGGSVLTKNIERLLGIKKPVHFDAHHIIPKKEPEALALRNMLESFNIHLDEAANGVWLKSQGTVNKYTKQGKADWLEGLGHVHKNHPPNSAYIEYLNQELIGFDSLPKTTENANLVRDQLQRIAKELTEGKEGIWP